MRILEYSRTETRKLYGILFRKQWLTQPGSTATVRLAQKLWISPDLRASLRSPQWLFSQVIQSMQHRQDGRLCHWNRFCHIQWFQSSSFFPGYSFTWRAPRSCRTSNVDTFPCQVQFFGWNFVPVCGFGDCNTERWTAMKGPPFLDIACGSLLSPNKFVLAFLTLTLSHSPSPPDSASNFEISDKIIKFNLYKQIKIFNLRSFFVRTNSFTGQN